MGLGINMELLRRLIVMSNAGWMMMIMEYTLLIDARELKNS